MGSLLEQLYITSDAPMLKFMLCLDEAHTLTTTIHEAKEDLYSGLFNMLCKISDGRTLYVSC